MGPPVSAGCVGVVVAGWPEGGFKAAAAGLKGNGNGRSGIFGAVLMLIPDTPPGSP